MAAVQVHDLPLNERDELLCSYAALILHAQHKEISADNINKIITAAGVKVEAYWPSLFAKAAASTNIGDLLTKIGTPSAGAAAAPASPSSKPADKKGPSPKKAAPKEEEEDADMGFSLFD
jgi:large subunit ribosomal protein LP1